MACTGAGPGFNNVAYVWVVTGQPAVPPTPAVPPRELGQRAEQSITLPSPAIGVNPPAFSVVNLATWLWVDPSIWHPYSATASAGWASATATATPTSVTWQMGNGQSVTCDGPGTPYDAALPASDQATSCSYTYRESSAGQPSPNGDPADASFYVTATVSWSVSWSGGGSSGVLPPLTTSSATHLRVEQVEAVEAIAPPA
jgi:hypothetical protein